jgi:hypothetical protein
MIDKPKKNKMNIILGMAVGIILYKVIFEILWPFFSK